MGASIYIDDTGTPEKSKSKYDPGNWKTWVAMILTEDEQAELVTIVGELQKNLKQKYNAEEFHFTNIFSAKKEFKKVNTEERINIFIGFAEIYKRFRFPLLIQSLTDDDITRNRMDIFRNLKIDNFDFSNIEHMSLWFLLNKIANEKFFKSYNRPFNIYVDAGKQKPNTKQKIEVLKKIAVDSSIIYVDSKQSPLIQFIDFVAFCTNRCRWILMNDKQSDSDVLLLNLSEYADFNFLNIRKMEVLIGKDKTSELYDKTLRATYDSNGNLSDEEMVKRKK